MKGKFVLALALALAMATSAYAGERYGDNGQLPYTPQPRNPNSTAYQPYFGYENQRRQQQSPSNCQTDRGTYRGYDRESGNGGYGGHSGSGKGHRH